MAPPENITTLSYRVQVVEHDVNDLRKQLDLYVPIRENDLRLQSMQESMRRIADDVKDMRGQLTSLADKLVDQDNKRNKLLIKVLWGTVSIIITILAALLINYITHLF